MFSSKKFFCTSVLSLSVALSALPHTTDLTHAAPIAPAERTVSPFREEQPANYVVLTWPEELSAVQYELELSQTIALDNTHSLPDSSQTQHLRRIFVNGAILNLSDWSNKRLFFRARPLDRNGAPIGPYTAPKRVRLNYNLVVPVRPIPHSELYSYDAPAPLYPTYSWIPVPGAGSYELEVTTVPPASVTDLDPDPYRLYAATIPQGMIEYYDWEPKRTAGTYYWRVRALDENGAALGIWSDATSYTIDTTPGGAASFGDSITHGGGGLSYGPSAPAFTYQNYLSFPCLNLGRSGDTSETMLARFEDDVLPFSPKYLIILGGSNSLRGGVAAEQVINELTQIGEKCRKHGIRPIFLTLPPINPDNIQAAFQEETVEDWQARFAIVNAFIRRQRYFIDITPAMTDEKGLLPTTLSLDGIHPDAPGKQIMADIINYNWSRVTR